ncbi:MAG TPA: hypothetical protein VII76_07370 [Acidimicrobiales bacterium]
MRRKTLDMIMTAGGAVLIVMLLVAGGLGMWGYNFANSNVHDQLAQQAITFPPAAAFTHAKAGTEITPSMVSTVGKFAGQPLLTGQQAQVYANDFIAVHLQEIGGGKTYSQLSAAAQADPTNTVLAGQVATVFKGTTLRGLLLEAYAFSTFGQIALVASIVSFVLAGIMLLLTMLGLLHLRRVPEDQEFPKVHQHEKVLASV